SYYPPDPPRNVRGHSTLTWVLCTLFPALGEREQAVIPYSGSPGDRGLRYGRERIFQPIDPARSASIERWRMLSWSAAISSPHARCAAGGWPPPEATGAARR